MADPTANDVKRVAPNENQGISKMAHPLEQTCCCCYMKTVRSLRENARRNRYHPKLKLAVITLPERKLKNKFYESKKNNIFI